MTNAQSSTAAGPVRSCPLCKHDNQREALHRYSRGVWHLKACRSCAFLYLENPPNYDDLDREFEWSGSAAAEKQRRRKEEPLLHKVYGPLKWWWRKLVRRDKLIALTKGFVSPGRVLDVGCGSGKRLSALPGPYVPFGIEISRILARQAEQHLRPRGGNVFHGPAVRWLNELQPALFNAVLMRAFLEHEIDPRAALIGAHRVLVDRGLIIIKVPNYNSLNRWIRGRRWCGFRLPDHVNYFSPRSIVRLLRDCGFSIIRFAWHDRFPTNDNMWLVARREPTVRCHTIQIG